MTRGRPRKPNPAIPAHIDQRLLPKGIYWREAGRFWYVLKPKWTRVAGEHATLAQLHTLMEDLSCTGQKRGTFAWLHKQFTDSQAWLKLSAASHKDYESSQLILTRTKTSTGGTYADLQVDRTTRVHLQLLIDAIGKSRPASANHVRRYLGRLLTWGMSHGKCQVRANPAHGLDGPEERGQFKMPTQATMDATVALARACGALASHSAGSCPPYLWIVLSLAYRLRLRGIEVLTLTEAHATEVGVRTNRRKGSRDNIVKWVVQKSGEPPRPDPLREAWDAALAYRDVVWAKTRHPVPMRPENRLLLVNETGDAIARSTLDSAWGRFIRRAIRQKKLPADERFTIHGLKHRGITDSKNKRDGGHATDTMANRYDHELPLVEQAGSQP